MKKITVLAIASAISMSVMGGEGFGPDDADYVCVVNKSSHCGFDGCSSADMDMAQIYIKVTSGSTADIVRVMRAKPSDKNDVQPYFGWEYDVNGPITITGPASMIRINSFPTVSHPELGDGYSFSESAFLMSDVFVKSGACFKQV